MGKRNPKTQKLSIRLVICGRAYLVALSIVVSEHEMMYDVPTNNHGEASIGGNRLFLVYTTASEIC